MTPLLEVKFGSHLYGTDTPESDLDIKVIYVPTAREIVLRSYQPALVTSRNKATFERNSKDDVDVEQFSLDRFLSDLMAGQTWALDVLFAYGNERATCPTPLGERVLQRILWSRELLLSRNVNAFIGYAKKQAARYGIKGSRMDAVRRAVGMLRTLPPAHSLWQHLDDLKVLGAECAGLLSLENAPLVSILAQEPKGDWPAPATVHLEVCGRKCPLGASVKHALAMYEAVLADYGERSHRAHLAGGVDWKALSHAVRVNNEAVELLDTGWITFPRPDRALLVDIKTGKMGAPAVYAMIEQGLVDLYEANARSTLRETPDPGVADDLVYEIYRDEVCRA